MPTSIPVLLRDLTPPLLWRGALRLRSLFTSFAQANGLPAAGKLDGLSGDYSAWSEALAVSTGYDNQHILDKTRTALLKVKNGEAAYERDSVLFDQIDYSWPVLAGLMWAASHCGGKLNVLDFGGSLGSTYYQHRAFFSMLSEVRWNIVEQPAYIETGNQWFADEHLYFYASIAECMADTEPGVVLLSSVLQYLEHPYTILNQLFELPCRHLIIDRTPFWMGPHDRLCVQTVPPDIYPASYPSWIFSKRRFDAHVPTGWQVIAEYTNTDRLRAPVQLSYQGAIIARSTNIS